MDDVKRLFREWRVDLEERFEALNARIEARFERRDPNEIFRALPAPSDALSVPMKAVMASRHSERSFSNEPLPDPVLADILWAAAGVRDIEDAQKRTKGRVGREYDGGRTTPTSFDWRETEIYVLKANGIWRWVPERRGLLFCALTDIRHLAAYMQPAMTLPPVQLVYVSNLAKTRTRVSEIAEQLMMKFDGEVWNDEAIEELRIRNTHLNVGVKLEAVSLAAEALGLASVARTLFPTKKLEEALHLGPDEHVTAVQSVGYKAKSFLDHIR